MKLEAASRLLSTNPQPSALCLALNDWCSSSISMSRPRDRVKQLKSAKFLARQPGQEFPSTVYRAFFVPHTMGSWARFKTWLKSTGNPESCAADLRGVKRFLEDGGGAGWTVETKPIVFAIQVQPSQMMFNVSQLIERLSPAEQRLDLEGFPLTVYKSHHEVVAKPGLLSYALANGKLSLVGYEENNGYKLKWIKPKVVTASADLESNRELICSVLELSP